MANLNEVRLIGNLTRDPQVRQTNTGQQVCEFGVATNRRYKDSSGQQQQETTFVDVTCWAKLAEVCGQYLRKGSSVYIGGRLKLDTWQDKQTGANRSKLSVTADNVQFLDKREQQQQPPAYGNATAGGVQTGGWSPN
jgi:single-strand DNA-binding protein